MPLSEKDRVERQVLRYLNFHPRSGVPLTADGESCERFECGDAALLLNTLTDMYTRNLFRLLPAPGRWGDEHASDSLLPGRPSPVAEELRRALERAIRAGASAMITSEGMRRYTELRSETREIRQADWQEAQRTGSPAGDGRDVPTRD